MKKSIIIASAAASLAAASFSVPVSASDSPVMTIGAPSIDYAVNGDTIEYEVTYSEDTTDIDLREGAVGLYGFTGNISISGEGNTRTVTVSDIDIDTEFDEHGYGEIYITINSGSGINENGGLTNGAKSEPIMVADHPYMTLQLRGDSVDEGGSIIVDATYRDSYDKKIIGNNLTVGHVGLYGFTGNVYTSSSDNYHATITVDNILDKDGDNYITVNAGTACDEKGGLSNGMKIDKFTINDNEAPVMIMSKPYASADGRSVCVDLTYIDDDLEGIDLKPGAIGLYGFTGDISISGEGNVRTIAVSNLKVNDDVLYITVNSGTGFDKALHLSNGCKSSPFTLGDGMKQAGDKEDANPETGVPIADTAGFALLSAAAVAALRKRKQ